MAEAMSADLVDKLELIEFILVDNWADLCHKIKFKDLLDMNKLAQTKAVEFKDKMKDRRFTEEERALCQMRTCMPLEHMLAINLSD